MTADHQEFDADVLVVGLGPMGATTALALAQQGVRVRAISRQRWLADSPRAHITNLRAMEVLRSLGVEREVLAQATPWEWMGDTLITTSLAGPEVARMRTWGTGDDRFGDYRRSSPCSMVDIPQTLAEPILVNAAGRSSATISFNTEYVSSAQDASGVDVRLRDRLTGAETTHRFRYVVGADGAKSRVFDDAGLTVEGRLARAGTVYARFRGDLSRYVAHRPSILNWIVNDDAAFGEIGLGLLRAVRPWDEWIAGWGFDVDAGEPDLSHETALARIRAYVGDPDFEAAIVAITPWYVNEAAAPRYSNGRILCGGDATHRHPPSSGLGSNTCIQDAFNLAWKLSFVIHGHAGAALLDTYSDERAPVGRQIVDRANQSRRDYAELQRALAPDAPGALSGLARLRDDGPVGQAARAALERALDLKNTEFNAQGVEMNQRYRSSAVIDDAGAGPERWMRDCELYAQATTRPGAKLPHAWLVDRTGIRVSTLDLVAHGGFTLITGRGGRGTWGDAAASLGRPWLRTVVIGDPGAEDLYFEWARVREVDEAGALLVRPDGVVAWRHATAIGDPDTARRMLCEASDAILSRETTPQPAAQNAEALATVETAA